MEQAQIEWQIYPLPKPQHILKIKELMNIFDVKFKHGWMFDDSTMADNEYTHILLWHEYDVVRYERYFAAEVKINTTG